MRFIKLTIDGGPQLINLDNITNICGANGVNHNIFSYINFNDEGEHGLRVNMPIESLIKIIEEYEINHSFENIVLKGDSV